MTLETITLRGERDVVSLRRRTRAAAGELGMSGRAVRSLSAAAYEAGRMLFAASGEADVDLRLVDGPALEVLFQARAGPDHPEMLAAVREQFDSFGLTLHSLVDHLSIDSSPLTITIALRKTFIPAEGVPKTEVHEDRRSPAEDGMNGAGGGVLVEEHEVLQRAFRELQLELQETDKGVVALYAELDEQAKQLRDTQEDLRRRADELAAANRAKEDFLATLSHELRTPLNAMLGWTRLVRSGRLDTAAMARALDTIERNAHMQEQLIADILDLSRIVTGKLRVDLRPVALAPILHAAVDTVRPGAAAKGVELTIEARDSVTALADPDRLQQVVWNLVANAIKFTPAGGRVAIALSRVQDEAVISVADTGEGIPPDLLPFIFDRFTQGDASATRLHGGLGLGLSIVRHIVELHGGRVHAASEGRGRGATVWVHLPLKTGATACCRNPASL